MTKDEALKMRKEQDEYWSKIIKQAEKALEQPAQEPVAWLSTNSIANEVIKSCSAPSWQGLSDDEIDDISICEQISPDRLWHIYVAIEQALKEKNT